MAATFRYHHDFENYTNGTSVGTGNSASGTSRAFDLVSYGAGTINANTTSPLVGSVSADVAGGTATAYVQWSVTGPRLVIRRAFKFAANPASTYTLMEIRSASAQVAGLALSTTGFFVAQIAGATTSGSSSSGLFAISLNTLYYAELYVSLESTTGAADGTIGYRILAADGTTVAYAGFALTGRSTGTAAIAFARFGSTKATGSGYTSDKIDELQASDLTTGWLGPYVAAPTANAGSDQLLVEPFTTVTLNGTGSTDPGASALTYAWTQTSGAAVTLSSTTAASPTFTAPATLAGTSLVFSLVVTNTGAQASNPDTVLVTVPPHTWWRRTSGTWKAIRGVPV